MWARANRRRLIARDSELRAVRDLVLHADGRLVTLIGPGGSGKTSIALEVCEDLVEAMADGVFLIDLSGERDPDAVALACCTALGLADQRHTPEDVLGEYLEPRQALLLVDNCEHLAQPTARLLDRLLSQCPDLRVLATSRAPLRVAGEQRFPVPGLEVPGQPDVVDPKRLSAVPAVELFLERARAVRPGFVLNQDNAPAVASICRALEGLPLAIELVAGRVAAFTPREISERLTHLNALGEPGRRSGPTRQRTMRATLDWSYELLTEAERTLLRRLSVFNGGWTLPACEAICGPLPDGIVTVAEALEGLVEHSLVVADTHEHATRYRLLEPIREYADERLSESGEAEETGLAHAEYYLASVVGRTRLPHLGPEDAGRIAAEETNCLAGMSRAQEAGAVSLVVGYAAGMAEYWRVRGQLRQGIRYLLGALQVVPRPSRARAFIVLALSNLEVFLGLHDDAEGHALEGLEIHRANGDRVGEWIALGMLGDVAAEKGEFEVALGLYDQARAIAEPAATGPAMAFFYANTGDFLLRSGHVDEAEARLEEARKRFAGLPPLWYSGRVLGQLGVIARRRGDTHAARRFLREGLEWLGRYQASLEAIPLIEEAARLETDRNAAERAATILAAAAALRDAIGALARPDVRQVLDGDIDRVRSRLSPPQFSAAWAAGREMTLDAAIAFAVGEEAGASQPSVPRHGFAMPGALPLTPREQEVAELVAKGLTNRAIAERLVIAPGTVRIHVERILSKLGITSRVQIATWVVTSGGEAATDQVRK